MDRLLEGWVLESFSADPGADFTCFGPGGIAGLVDVVETVGDSSRVEGRDFPGDPVRADFRINAQFVHKTVLFGFVSTKAPAGQGKFGRAPLADGGFDGAE